MPNQIQVPISEGSLRFPPGARFLLFVAFLIPILFLSRNAAAAVAPVITSAKSISATAGSTFSYQIGAINSPTSYGAQGLPSGPSINTSTGAITGTPTAVATSTVTLSATNRAGTGVATLTLSIVAKSTFVQAASNANSATAKSASLAFAENTLAGDVILVGFDFADTSASLSVTDSQGNTFTEVGSQLTSPGGSGSVVYLAKNIKGGADTITVNLASNSGWLELFLTEYSGVNPTNPIDVQAGASGSAGSVSSGNATTAYAGDIIYGFCVADWSCTVGSGFTAWSTFNDNLIESKTAGSAGAYAATGSANNGWTMQMVALRPAAAASAPAVSLSPGSLTFASQVVDASSAAQAITVTNSGNAALTISGIAVTGANATDFAQTSTCGSSLAAGATCAINVTFTPNATGSLAAAVTLTDNATGSPQSVALAGTGASVGATKNAAGGLSTSSLSFGSEAVGVVSASQVVTLTNSSSTAMTISSIALTGSGAADFSQVSTCGASLAAAGQCTIVVLFTPSAIGTFTASLTVTDNAAGSPQSVSLSGTGGHDVVLTWTASVSSGVSGYNIYRGTTSGGETSTPLNLLPINGTTYTDVNVTAGDEYYYVVTAVGSNDAAQSSGSTQISATVP
jgi:hypothetical protein